MTDLKTAQVGARVWFSGEKRPYKVRARNERYLICVKPFNARKTVLYSIVDIDEDIRGRDNLIFGLGYENDESITENMHRLSTGEMEVSHRHRVPLRVERVAA
jgi:hypothetical protein